MSSTFLRNTSQHTRSHTLPTPLTSISWDKLITPPRRHSFQGRRTLSPSPHGPGAQVTSHHTTPQRDGYATDVGARTTNSNPPPESPYADKPLTSPVPCPDHDLEAHPTLDDRACPERLRTHAAGITIAGLACLSSLVSLAVAVDFLAVQVTGPGARTAGPDRGDVAWCTMSGLGLFLGLYALWCLGCCSNCSYEIGAVYQVMLGICRRRRRRRRRRFSFRCLRDEERVLEDIEGALLGRERDVVMH